MSAFDLLMRKVGLGSPCFIIAEAGVNHNGRLDMAIELVDVAVKAGVDAVKFQTFIAEKVVSPCAVKAAYQQETTGADESQLAMLKKLELPFDSFRQLKQYCDQTGIMFMSTPFDKVSADFLDELGMAAFKIPSGEVLNHPFLVHLAKKSKPIIMSTGMCNLREVADAVAVLRAAGNRDLALLHCVSNYPANPAHTNLRAMATMSSALGVPVGYSDHTLGNEVSLAAVALGACIIEKHFTLDQGLEGPDHRASASPHELAELVRGIRLVEQALGNGKKEAVAAEEDTKRVSRRSLVLNRTIQEGEFIELDALDTLRPASGISPDSLSRVIGKTAVRKLDAGTILQWKDLV